MGTLTETADLAAKRLRGMGVTLGRWARELRAVQYALSEMGMDAAAKKVKEIANNIEVTTWSLRSIRKLLSQAVHGDQPDTVVDGRLDDEED